MRKNIVLMLLVAIISVVVTSVSVSSCTIMEYDKSKPYWIEEVCTNGELTVYRVHIKGMWKYVVKSDSGDVTELGL